MTRRRKITIFGGIAGVLFIAAVSARGGGDDSTAVRFETVERRDLISSVTASGRIEAQRSVDVSSDITGRIVEILVDEGAQVQRGQLVLRIDPAQYEAAVSRAEAMLASARASELQAKANRDQALRTRERAEQLQVRDSNLVSVEQVETAVTTYEVANATWVAQQHQVAQAEAQLAEAQDQLSKTILHAPMSGKVTRLAVEEGEVALASTFSRETGLLMTISDLSVIQVTVDVDETDVVRLAVGDSASMSIDAFPDTTFAGRVTRISQSANQSAAGGGNDQAVDYEVEIVLNDPPEQIRPDLSATAKIITDTRTESLSIPIIALTVRDHTPMPTESNPDLDTTEVETEGVFIVRDGRA
ncbi:MAG: efflux RND transporter periplasmic adaptor subunit, partial [Gemmatimonadales bacterium]